MAKIGNEESGWKTHFTDTHVTCDKCDPELIQKCKSFCCKEMCFWGFKNGYNIGSMSAKFRSTGRGVVNFGNCYKTGAVHAYFTKTGNKVHNKTAYHNQHSVTFSFSYEAGDVLTIEEHHLGVIQLNSLSLSCN